MSKLVANDNGRMIEEEVAFERRNQTRVVGESECRRQTQSVLKMKFFTPADARAFPGCWNCMS